jgi:hypothetical protein
MRAIGDTRRRLGPCMPSEGLTAMPHSRRERVFRGPE